MLSASLAISPTVAERSFVASVKYATEPSTELACLRAFITSATNRLEELKAQWLNRSGEKVTLCGTFPGQAIEFFQALFLVGQIWEARANTLNNATLRNSDKYQSAKRDLHALVKEGLAYQLPCETSVPNVLSSRLDPASTPSTMLELFGRSLIWVVCERPFIDGTKDLHLMDRVRAAAASVEAEQAFRVGQYVQGLSELQRFAAKTAAAYPPDSKHRRFFVQAEILVRTAVDLSRGRASYFSARALEPHPTCEVETARKAEELRSLPDLAKSYEEVALLLEMERYFEGTYNSSAPHTLAAFVYAAEANLKDLLLAEMRGKVISRREAITDEDFIERTNLDPLVRWAEMAFIVGKKWLERAKEETAADHKPLLTNRKYLSALFEIWVKGYVLGAPSTREIGSSTESLLETVNDQSNADIQRGGWQALSDLVLDDDLFEAVAFSRDVGPVTSVRSKVLSGLALRMNAGKYDLVAAGLSAYLRAMEKCVADSGLDLPAMYVLRVERMKNAILTLQVLNRAKGSWINEASPSVIRESK